MSIEIICGPMFSGKSTELLRIHNKYKVKKKVLIVNHKIDTRYGENIVSTHNKIIGNAITLENLKDLFGTHQYKNCDVILIDESQFFTDLFDFSLIAVGNDKKIIIIFGLNGDCEQKKFGQITDLMPHADCITHLTAFCHYCKDMTKAPFTKRIKKSKKEKQIEVGSEELYVAVCRKHLK